MRRFRVFTVSLSLLAAIAVPVHAGADEPSSASPAVSVFADVPAPGHPWGIIVHDDHVIVSTSAGGAARVNTQGERIFTFDTSGSLQRTTVVDEGPASNMGLAGMAFDGDGRLYVADMNGLIRRYGPGDSSEVWASSPLPYSAGSWWTSMWNDIDFDGAGNAYVTDGGAGAIWRIAPDGTRTPQMWFSDSRLAGVGGTGPFLAQIDPSGKYFYFMQAYSAVPDRFGAGEVFRLPLIDTPQASDLQEIHRFPVDSGDIGFFAEHPPYPGPIAMGLTIGASGRLYVSLVGRNEIAVLDPSGQLIRTLTSPLFDFPFGTAFLGDRLLVANGDWHNTPDKWRIYSIDVDDTGITPFIPQAEVL